MATILIVEDESIIARDVAGRLEEMGHAVSGIVGSGEEAIQQATSNQPDLVLMDIILQGNIDGIEAAERIQSGLRIPVVYLTAHADSDTLRRAKFTEPFGYILKPFRDLEFDATIEMALSRFQAEARMLKEIETFEELVALRTRYTTLVAHEFRVPLSDIQTSIDQLEQQGDRSPTPQRVAYLQRIRTALKNMKQLLRDVESFSQAQIPLTFHPAPIELTSFCQDLVDELRLGLATQTEVVVAIEPNLPPARMDERLLRHILTNLLSNAIKYSPQDQPVYFEVELAYPDVEGNAQPSQDPLNLLGNSGEFQSLALDPQSQMVVFRVRDRGIGIPENNQAELFEAFYRADNVGNIPGIGMGLPIVKQCVDLHCGSLTFSSSTGEGTTFKVTLPLWSEEGV